MSNENSPWVQVSRNFPASKDGLYRAWTEPEQLKQWWKPMNKQLVSVENDIREGGKVIYVFEDNLKIKGEYKEVQAGGKLVYSWNWEMPEDSMHKGEYLLTVEFKSEGPGSTLNVTQENFRDEHAIKPHEEGWNQALDNLGQFLNKQ